MRQANYNLFRQAIARLENEYGLKLSGVAKEIIYQILDAAIRDPHPNWNLKTLGADPKDPGAGPLDVAQTKAIQSLPELLGKLNLRKQDRPVTTFEILHAMWPALNGIIFKDVPE